jgi:hypothetical protein
MNGATILGVVQRLTPEALAQLSDQELLGLIRNPSFNFRLPQYEAVFRKKLVAEGQALLNISTFDQWYAVQLMKPLQATITSEAFTTGITHNCDVEHIFLALKLQGSHWAYHYFLVEIIAELCDSADPKSYWRQQDEKIQIAFTTTVKRVGQSEKSAIDIHGSVAHLLLAAWYSFIKEKVKDLTATDLQEINSNLQEHLTNATQLESVSGAALKNAYGAETLAEVFKSKLFLVARASCDSWDAFMAFHHIVPRATLAPA